VLHFYNKKAGPESPAKRNMRKMLCTKYQNKLQL